MSAADWPVFVVLYGTDGCRHSRFYAGSFERVEQRLRAPALAEIVQAHAFDDREEVTFARPTVGGAWVVTRVPRRKDGA